MSETKFKKKVLFVATVDEHLKHFHLPYMRWFKNQGYEVHIASNGKGSLPYCDRKFHVPYQRTPFSFDNLKASIELFHIVKENHYTLIHLHTPIAGVLGRLSVREARRQGTKILYTAHGFHFFKGAPIINWLLFYPAERIAAFFTDCLITMNQEDFERACRWGLQQKGKCVYKIPGIGVDCEKLISNPIKASHTRYKMGVPDNAFLVLSVGELIPRKNTQLSLKAISMCKDADTHYVHAGRGPEEIHLKNLARSLKIYDNVHFLGYCVQLADIYGAADLFVFPSVQEGLPVALLEAMSSGLPCAASKIRGHTDIIIDNESGVLFESGNAEELARIITLLKQDWAYRQSLGKNARVRSQKFDLPHAMEAMTNIYKQYLGDSDVP